jgi:putative transposase
MIHWRLYYHVVWGTKNRLGLIQPAWEQDLYDYIWRRAVTLDCIPRAIGGMPDHIHVVISVPPQLSIAALIVQLKGTSLHYINAEYTDGLFHWQSEYAVVSLSEDSLPVSIDYVNEQKKHHTANRLIYAMENS